MADNSEAGEGKTYEFSAEAIANLNQRLKSWIDSCVDEARKICAEGEVFNPPAISVRELTNAMREVNTDLGFLTKRRRLHESGISPGKVGGTLAYRLTRHRIFNFDKDSCEAKAVENFPETVIIGLILEALEINWESSWIQENLGKRFSTSGVLGQRIHPNIIAEISFLLRKRHCNQETLAIVFDTLCLLDSSVREITALREQNRQLKARVEELTRQRTPPESS